MLFMVIQQVDRLLEKVKGGKDKKGYVKKKTAKFSDKLMKKFKSFVEDENLKDFEEDLIGEAPPNTADAMKRYKAVRRIY